MCLHLYLDVNFRTLDPKIFRVQLNFDMKATALFFCSFSESVNKLLCKTTGTESLFEMDLWKCKSS